MPDLEERLDYLLDRLRSAYDAIGHSSGRPYVYFVYPPDQERAVRRLADERLSDGHGLCFHHLDLLPLTISALAGQEERREQLLADPCVDRAPPMRHPAPVGAGRHARRSRTTPMCGRLEAQCSVR